MVIFNIDFGDLEIDNIGSWPPPIKQFLLILLFSLVLLLGYLYDISDLLDNYSAAQQNIESLKLKYEDAHNKVSNLDAYQEQMKVIQKTFDLLKKQLPKRSNGNSDDAALLEEISQQSDVSGLNFRYMKPGATLEKGFYMEYPIELSISGGYHNIGEFVSNISNMPRIITLHNFDLRSTNTNNPNNDKLSTNENGKINLEMTIQAKTYWTTSQTE